MKKIVGISIIVLFVTGTSLMVGGCAPTAAISAKSGSALWGENCIRCHNAPPSADYSPAQWEVIGTHMKLRANLTEEETNKIVGYLKSVN
jgi:cytochrome c2